MNSKVGQGFAAQEGSVTVVMAGLAVIITILLSALIVYVKIEISFTQAQSNADLVAISVVKSYYYSEKSPCEIAERVAVANGGKLIQCSLNDDGVEVQVAQGYLAKAKAKAKLLE